MFNIGDNFVKFAVRVELIAWTFSNINKGVDNTFLRLSVCCYYTYRIYL